MKCSLLKTSLSKLGSLNRCSHALLQPKKVSALRDLTKTLTLTTQQQARRQITRFPYDQAHVCSTYSKEMASNNSDDSRIEAAIIDLSGTLHIEDTAIPGSQAAIQRLKDSGIKIKYVTNTTKEPLRVLHERMCSLNFGVEKKDIFTSLSAARCLIENMGIRPLLYLEESAKEDFEGISTENPNAVVIGLAPNTFNYEPMTKAFRMVLEGAPLIAIHKARYFKKKDGLYLGPGPFVSALEYATDTKATVVGKPQTSFFLESIKDLGVHPQNTVMIGDDVRDDVGGAMKAGMKGILVRTGKYRPQDEEKISPLPTAVCADFPAAVDHILKNNI